MPIDRKRINGPEESVPYQLFTRLNIKSFTKRTEELVTNKKRADGRSCLEHRKIFLKTGVVSQAKGSAYIEVGKTKVIVSVFDPREIPNRTDYCLKGEIYCEFKFAPFSCHKRKLHQQDNDEKQFSSLLKQALEAVVCRHEFPNFQVDIYALVLHNDGSALSAAITASGLALGHAGVPMYDIITATTLGIQQDIKLLDPALEEENLCSIETLKDNTNHGTIIIAKLHSQEQISQFYQTGNLCLADLNESLDIMNKACADVAPLVQKCLAKHVIKNIEKDVED